MTEKEWLVVKDASALYDPNMKVNYFRTEFCAIGGIIQQQGGLRVRWGPTGKRRVLLISRSVILAMIEAEKKRGA